jgi:hypothetical protein
MILLKRGTDFLIIFGIKQLSASSPIDLDSPAVPWWLQEQIIEFLWPIE